MAGPPFIDGANKWSSQASELESCGNTAVKAADGTAKIYCITKLRRVLVCKVI